MVMTYRLVKGSALTLAEMDENLTDLAQYRISGTFITAPTASEILLFDVADADYTFPADFSGSRLATIINPTATATLLIRKLSSGVLTTIGEILISTSGVATFTSTGGVAQAIVDGEAVVVVAQAVPDATFAQFGLKLRGIRT